MANFWYLIGEFSIFKPNMFSIRAVHTTFIPYIGNGTWQSLSPPQEGLQRFGLRMWRSQTLARAILRKEFKFKLLHLSQRYGGVRIYPIKLLTTASRYNSKAPPVTSSIEPSSLLWVMKKRVRSWYNELSSRCIHSFCRLCHGFVQQFVTNKVMKKSGASSME